MDLVELIEEKYFLGQEFLTWLWYKSDERGGTVMVPGHGDIILVFEKHMLLESGEGESLEKLICRGLQSELKEARTGLAMGKKVEQSRIHLVKGDYEYHLTLRGSMLDFSSVKPPKTMEGAEESNDPDAVEGRMLDRIGLYEELIRIINDLFRMFLVVRTGSEWETEVAAIRTWIHKYKAA